ncbi:hypothetical protein QBC35DRAFT_263580 [Podospora australis]|uniref:Uncharacterized protein n=1 Tax=Podospora australis TaxID=1536484 RepID=A0AAN6X1E7_9PEZI|nr:hypothetical protein QBC35DRAFT_263580 [Podospora australis]
MIRDIFALLHEKSWELVTRFACSEHIVYGAHAIDTLFFKQATPRPPLLHPPPLCALDWLVIGMGESKRVRIVCRDDNNKHAVCEGLPKILYGLELDWESKWSHSYVNLRVTLKSTPVQKFSLNNVMAKREMTVRILEMLEGMGWKVYTAGAGGNLSDVWYFVRPKQKDWKQGEKLENGSNVCSDLEIRELIKPGRVVGPECI